MFFMQSLKKARFLALFLIVAAFVAAGHHFVIVASNGGAVTTNTFHYDLQTHPEHEHESPVTTVEAHTLTPIVQKFQLQKQFSMPAGFVRNNAFVEPPARTDNRILAYVREPKTRVPLDLKTTFLN